MIMEAVSVAAMATKRRRKSKIAKTLLEPPPAAAATKPFFFSFTTTWLELLVTVLGSPTSMVVDSFAILIILSCNWGLKKDKSVCLCIELLYLWCETNGRWTSVYIVIVLSSD